MKKFFYQRYVAISVFTATTLFMAIPDAGNAVYFSLFLASMGLLIFRGGQSSLPRVPDRAILPLVLLAAPISAVAISQALRVDLKLSEFDAPSRFLAGYAIFLLVSKAPPDHRFTPSKAFGWGAIFGLITVLFAVDPGRTLVQGGRLATKLSWPNDLGAYSGILLTFIIWLFLTHRVENIFARVFTIIACFIGMTVGIYIFLGAQSRGPWIATTITILVLLVIEARRRSKVARIVSLCIIAASLGPLAALDSNFSKRLTSTFTEPAEWLINQQDKTSTGERVSMAVASTKLISMAPFTGFGDFGYLAIGCGAEFKSTPFYSHALCKNSGPHNEFLARGLQSGIWGLLATSVLLILPICWFGYQMVKFKKNFCVYNPALLGFVFSINIATVCFFMEPYSIKFTATFNALVLSVLFGEIFAAKRMLNLNSLKT